MKKVKKSTIETDSSNDVGRSNGKTDVINSDDANYVGGVKITDAMVKLAQTIELELLSNELEQVKIFSSFQIYDGLDWLVDKFIQRLFILA